MATPSQGGTEQSELEDYFSKNRIEYYYELENEQYAWDVIKTMQAKAGRYSGKEPQVQFDEADLDPMDLDETLYFLEAGVSFEHYDPIKSEGKHESYFATLTVDRNSTDGLIYETDLMNAYEHFLDESNNNIPTGKNVLVVNAYYTRVASNEVEVEMEIYYSESVKGTALSASDDWKPIMDWGYCTSSVTYDAQSRLDNLIGWYGPHGWNGSTSNSSGGTAIACPSGVGYWSNVDTEFWNPGTWSSANQNWGGNTLGSSIPWVGYTTDCIDDTQMEELLHDHFLMIDEELPAGMKYVDYQIFDWGVLGTTGNMAAQLTFAEYNCSTLPW